MLLLGVMLTDYIRFQVKYKKLLRKYYKKQQMKKIYRALFIVMFIILNIFMLYVSIPSNLLVSIGSISTTDQPYITINDNLIYITSREFDIKRLITNVNFSDVIYIDKGTAILVVPENYSGQVFIQYGTTQRVFIFDNFVKIISYSVDYYPVVNELNPKTNCLINIRTTGYMETPTIKVLGMKNISYSIYPISIDNYVIYVNGIVTSEHVKIIISAKNMRYDYMINLRYIIKHPVVKIDVDSYKYTMNVTSKFIVIPINIIVTNFNKNVRFKINYKGNIQWMNKLSVIDVSSSTTVLFVFRVNTSGVYDIKLTFTPINVVYPSKSVSLTIIKPPSNHTTISLYHSNNNETYIIINIPTNITSIIKFVHRDGYAEVKIFNNGAYIIPGKEFKELYVYDYYYGEEIYYEKITID